MSNDKTEDLKDDANKKIEEEKRRIEKEMNASKLNQEKENLAKQSLKIEEKKLPKDDKEDPQEPIKKTDSPQVPPTENPPEKKKSMWDKFKNGVKNTLIRAKKIAPNSLLLAVGFIFPGLLILAPLLLAGKKLMAGVGYVGKKLMAGAGKLFGGLAKLFRKKEPLPRPEKNRTILNKTSKQPQKVTPGGGNARKFSSGLNQVTPSSPKQVTPSPPKTKTDSILSVPKATVTSTASPSVIPNVVNPNVVNPKARPVGPPLSDANNADTENAPSP